MLVGLALARACAARRVDAQITLDTADVTYGYAGIGPITWPKTPALKAVIAVPHFSAGPTIRCPEYVHKCEIDVVLRNIPYYMHTNKELLAELQEQFAHLDAPPPTDAKFLTQVSARHYAMTYIDTRPSAKYRFTTAALLIQGPAVFQVFAQANDSASVAAVIALAERARVVRVREFLAFRFGQYTRACTVRVPASRAPNEAAIAASPFTDAPLLAFMRQGDSTFTRDKLLEQRTSSDTAFLEALDELKPGDQRTFCGRLPGFIKDAAAEL